jgi:hypothetical protein
MNTNFLVIPTGVKFKDGRLMWQMIDLNENQIGVIWYRPTFPEGEQYAHENIDGDRVFGFETIDDAMNALWEAHTN